MTSSLESEPVAAGAICCEAADNLRELRRLRGEIESLAESLDEEAFLRKQAPQKWSVGECIAHLNATARPYLDKLPAAIEAARSDGLTGEGPIKRGLPGRLFLWLIEPPSRLRFKAPQPFQPQPNQSKDEIMREFRQIRDELAQVIESGGDLDWSRAKMGLPTLPGFKLRQGEIFAVLLAHERRHLLQANKAAAAG